MNDRYLPLWIAMQTIVLAGLILAGLLFASWREGELRFKFSLSTMLIMMTLIAALLWLIQALIALVASAIS
jgi:hypothetical protein